MSTNVNSAGLKMNFYLISEILAKDLPAKAVEAKNWKKCCLLQLSLSTLRLAMAKHAADWMKNVTVLHVVRDAAAKAKNLIFFEPFTGSNNQLMSNALIA